MEQLERNKVQIQAIFQLSPEISLSDETDWASDDPRIVDIRLFEGKNKSLVDKFRSSLSEISLADDFTAWEASKYGETRVDALCRDIEAVKNKRGHIKFWVEHEGFLDQERAQKYTDYGIKWLVFDRIYSRAAFQDRQPRQGILGILFCCSRLFTRLKYSYYQELAIALRSSDWKYLAEYQASWMQMCIANHNSERPSS
ncbi:hypothetical protein BDV59DRAFT_162747 [Aspergillus ambiguus]|uniref:uncharacterized protein n=1 Tax=Aspergillus ambiguus TaxID=176160 RepID=UPI003CCE161F